MKYDDKEFFNLCKQVYDLKLWPYESMSLHDRHFWHKLIDWDYKDIKVIKYGQIVTKDGTTICPVYSADYILEKMPDFGESRHWSLTVDHEWDENGLSWAARYVDNDDNDLGTVMDLYESSNTPIKALLKLLIKLNQRGLWDKQ